MSMKWKKNGWSDEELVAAKTCRDRQWTLTKTWAERRYTIYNLPHSGVTRANELMHTYSLSEVYTFLNIEL